MSATGLDPDDWRTIIRTQLATHNEEKRRAEFDRLMAQGGIEAVVEALRKEQATAPASDPEAQTRE